MNSVIYDNIWLNKAIAEIWERCIIATLYTDKGMTHFMSENQVVNKRTVQPDNDIYNYTGKCKTGKADPQS